MSSSSATQLVIFLETLEDRIAPATITIGGNYSDNSALTSTGAENADAAIKSFFDASENHYYLKLNKGDKLVFDADGPDAPDAAVNWIEIKTGTALVFLTDDGDGVIELDELTGLSVGGKASMKVFTDVNGSIVTNLNGTTGAFLGNTLADGAKNLIAELSVAGSVNGSLLSLGSISKVTVEGSIDEILTGSATSCVDFDFGGDTGKGQGTADKFTPAAKLAGPSITGVSATDLVALVAGDGGAQAAGGSISTVNLTIEDGCVIIQAGNGGDGEAGAINGGAGGKVTKVTIAAGAQNTGQLIIASGSGGEGFLVTEKKTGKGGNAGVVDQITVSAEYDKATKSWIPAGQLVTNVVNIVGGFGGSGKTGGAGGKISNTAVFAQDAPIFLYGGDGGDAIFTNSTKDGAGGGIDRVTAVSLASDEDAESGIFLTAGAAGNPCSCPDEIFGTGAAGGSVSNTVLGARFVMVIAGDGSTGKMGGAGGSISGLSINSPYVALSTITLAAGFGGDGLVGAGGAGGAIKDVVVDNAPYLLSLPGAAPDDAEGISVAPTMANQNTVISSPALDVEILEGDDGTSFNDVTISSTVYGDVALTVDLGGSLEIEQTVFGKVILTEGIFISGDLLVNGPSEGVFIATSVENGESGEMEIVLVPFTEDLYPEYVGGEVFINPAEAPVPELWKVDSFDLGVQAGYGGNGAKAGGKGGTISSSTFAASPSAFSSYALEGHDLSWELRAGNGGDGNGKAGAGGNLAKLSIVAETLGNAGFANSGFFAGDGGHAIDKGTGGNGGSVRGSAFSLTGTNSSTSFLEIEAGIGGDGTNGGKGGAGGSVMKDGKEVSVFTTISAIIAAGQGGESDDATTGAGGSISNLTVEAAISETPDDPPRDVQIRAGDAGAGDTAKGAAGGSIKNVQIFSNDDVNFTLIAGNGNKGQGGSIENLSQSFENLLNTWDGDEWVTSLNSSRFSVLAEAGSSTGGPGNGGHIKSVNLVAPSTEHSYQFVAGNGGEGEKPGNGGTIEKISIVDSAVITSTATGKPKKQTVTFDDTNPGFAGVGAVALASGDGGNSTGAANGGNGGNVKTVFWDVDGLARMLTLGAGGTSVGGLPGKPGTATNINPPVS